MSEDLELHAVVHLVRPLRLRARGLAELREGVAAASPTSLFHHAVQYQLRAPTDDELPPDDFSAWAHGVLQDREAAERLSFAIQSAPRGSEPLRGALLRTLAGLHERPGRAAPEGGEFVFLAVDSVAVSTGVRARDPAGLMEGLARAAPSVWFYHLIERPWFDEADPEVTGWLRARGEDALAGWLAHAAASGRPIGVIRRQLLERWRRRRLGVRVAEAARRPEGERAAAAHDAVAGLVRRLRRPEERS